MNIDHLISCHKNPLRGLNMEKIHKIHLDALCAKEETVDKEITAIDLSPKNRFLATTTRESGTFIIKEPCRKGRSVSVWLPDTTLRRRNVLFSPRGDLLAINNNTANCLTVRHVGEWARLDTPEVHVAGCCCCWISSEKLLCGGGERRVTCVDVNQGVVVETQLTGSAWSWLHQVWSLDVNRDHSMLACGEACTWSLPEALSVVIVDLRDKSIQHSLPFTHYGFNIVSFSQDSRFLLNSIHKTPQPRILEVWDLRTWKLFNRIEESGRGTAQFCLASRPDIVTSSFSTGNGHNRTHAVRCWSAETGRTLVTFRGHDGPVYGLAGSEDGQQLITGNQNGSITFCDLHDVM